MTSDLIIIIISIIIIILEKATLHIAGLKRSTQKSELSVVHGWCGSVIN